MKKFEFGPIECMTAFLGQISHTMRNLHPEIKYRIVGPLKIEGVGKDSSNNEVFAIRYFIEVEGSPLQFPVEAVQWSDGITDLMIGVTASDGKTVELSEMILAHMQEFLDQDILWDYDILDIEKYKKELQLHQLPSLDWLFLRRVHIITPVCMNEEIMDVNNVDPFDYEIVSWTWCDFIKAFGVDALIGYKDEVAVEHV